MWRGEDGDHWENRALRSAMTSQVPVVWFFGVGEVLWLPIFPVYVLDEEAAERQFVVDPDVSRGLVTAGSPVEEHLRRYILTQTRSRLHQPVFRATVLRAYETRCTVCALTHRELLDAAISRLTRALAGSRLCETDWPSMQAPPRGIRSQHPWGQPGAQDLDPRRSACRG